MGPSRCRRHGVALVVAVQVMAGWDHRDQLDHEDTEDPNCYLWIYIYIYTYFKYIYIFKICIYIYIQKYIYIYLKYVYIYIYILIYLSICLISWDRGQHNQIHQHSAFNLRSWVNTAGASCFLGKSAVPSRTGAVQCRGETSRHGTHFRSFKEDM